MGVTREKGFAKGYVLSFLKINRWNIDYDFYIVLQIKNNTY